MLYTPFLVTCDHCGHRNLPRRRTFDAASAALLGELGNCHNNKCKKPLRLDANDPQMQRPIVQRARKLLIEQGRLDADGNVIPMLAPEGSEAETTELEATAV